MTSKDFFIGAIFFALGIAGNYYFYINGRINDLQAEIDSCIRENNGNLEELTRIKEKDENLVIEVKKAQIENEYKEQEIKYLEGVISDKEKAISNLNLDIERKNSKIDKLYVDLRKVIEEGATDEVKNRIKELTLEIEKLTNEKQVLVRERNGYSNQLRKLELKLLEKEKRIKMYAEVEIPELRDKINALRDDMSFAQQFKEYINMRAEIESLEIDRSSGNIKFELHLEQHDVEYLRANEKFENYTFSPYIENESENVIYYLGMEELRRFVKPRGEIAQYMIIEYPIGKSILKQYKDGQKGINYTRGDKFKISVRIRELNDLEIGNMSFYLK